MKSGRYLVAAGTTSLLTDKLFSQGKIELYNDNRFYIVTCTLEGVPQDGLLGLELSQ